MIGLGAAAFYILPVLRFHSVNKLILLPIFILQIGLAFWLWLFALNSRYPQFKPENRHWAVLIFKVILTIAWAYPNRSFFLDLSDNELLIWRIFLPAAFTLVLIILAIITAAQKIYDELNQDARDKRHLTIFYGGGALIINILIFIIFRGPKLQIIGQWITVVFGVILISNIYILIIKTFFYKRKDDDLKESEIPEYIITAKERELAQRIEESFNNEEVFKTEGFTVTMLASHLQEKEYKVRLAINHVMGYRNFNEFLNKYRIEAAKEILIKEPELQVIRLSMDLGYRSLAGFNKAFKEQTSLTPTEYRNSSNLK